MHFLWYDLLKNFWTPYDFSNDSQLFRCGATPNSPLCKATCLGVASPKLHLVTRAATLVESMSTACYHHPKMYQDMPENGENCCTAIHMYEKKCRTLKVICCCCSVNILQKFSVMNSRMFHDFLYFSITTSHSRQKKQAVLHPSYEVSSSFQGTFSTRLRHMEYKTLALLLTWWPKNDSDSKNEILILEGELTYYRPMERRWNHLPSLLLWGDMRYIMIYTYHICMSSLEDKTLVLLVTGSHDLGQNIQSMTTLTSTTTATARRPLFPNIPDTILSGAFLRWTQEDWPNLQKSIWEEAYLHMLVMLMANWWQIVLKHMVPTSQKKHAAKLSHH